MALVTKLCPYELWEVDAIEGWLDDMASQGYILDRQEKGYKLYFQEEAPQKQRYRIDAHEKKKGERQRREELYREFGWEYVASLDPRMDIYRATRADAVELNTDEETLRQALDISLGSYQRWMVIISLFMVFILWWLVRVFTISGFYWWVMTTQWVSVVPLLLWMLLFGMKDARYFSAYFQARRRALLERSYHTPQRAKRRTRARVAELAVNLLILIVLLFKLGMDNQPTAEIIHLQETDYSTYSLSAILPQAAEVLGEPEQGWLAKGRLVGRNVYYSQGELQLDIFDVSPRMAEQYALEAARKTEARPVEVSGYERAWYFEGRPYWLARSRSFTTRGQGHNLILLQGGRVVDVHYEGEPAWEEIVPFG